MRHAIKTISGAAMAVAIAGAAHAQNAPPPVGEVLLDLAGQTIPDGTGTVYTNYTTSFVATGTASTVSFVFRNDPGYFAFDNASVVDSLAPATNLLTNPSFETGSTSGSLPVGWTYAQEDAISGQSAGSGVYANTDAVPGPLSAQDGNNFFVSGAYNGYDYIYQTFATTIGDTYDVGFYLANYDQADSDPTAYQQVSSINGPGIDMLVYGPDPIPEPATLALFGIGMAALGWVRRRRA